MRRSLGPASVAVLAVAACGAFRDGSAVEPADASAPDDDAGTFDAGAPPPVDDDGGTSLVDAAPPAKLVDAAPIESGAKRVFVTAQAFVGTSLGRGGANAHATCNALAKSRGLPGTWRAWLSFPGSSAAADLQTNGTGDWYLLDGNLAVLRAKLTSPPIEQAIDVDQDNMKVGDLKVWTGTFADGGVGSTCTQWSTGWNDGGSVGTVGSTNRKTVGWTDTETAPCATSAQLYCFEQ